MGVLEFYITRIFQRNGWVLVGIISENIISEKQRKPVKFFEYGKKCRNTG